ncbi:hypothetical protein PVK06_043159 [Gossypium arboreum]|uniref:Uncharacterized protein n=1 Tax=Gossypium arboreum TaxID=29729 RepID=A0ABR0MN51_GOSAR|nr:hypothetical protein PVK06_043159 [Gossypium arboreum]
MKEKEIEKEKENEREKNKIEIEKECGQETQVEKESETEERKEIVKETSVVEFPRKETEVKEREFDNELEKETSEKDKREQEKVRNVFTNQHDSRDSNDKFQLHYLPVERRFLLIEKVKVEDEIKPQVLKGKHGKDSLAIESWEPNLNDDEVIANDLVIERSPHFDLINCHPMINVDEVIPTSGIKSFSHDFIVLVSLLVK